MSRFQGVLLTSLSDNAGTREIQTEVRKALLDLLKNDNALYDELFPISGSNSNGNYIKLPGGFLIQSGAVPQASITLAGSGIAFVGGPVTITFPVPFIDTNYYMPLPSPTQPISSSGLWTGNTADGNRLTTSNRFFIWGPAAATTSIGLTWVAMGKWE